jgi:metal-dependent hydrolase (beta-lactamase superfamily II)
MVPDSVPEDMSLVINTDKGHRRPHRMRTRRHREYRGVRSPSRRASPVYAVVGGLHLFAAKDDASGVDR